MARIPENKMTRIPDDNMSRSITNRAMDQDGFYGSVSGSSR